MHPFQDYGAKSALIRWRLQRIKSEKVRSYGPTSANIAGTLKPLKQTRQPSLRFFGVAGNGAAAADGETWRVSQFSSRRLLVP
jgi:hypothetical protein